MITREFKLYLNAGVGVAPVINASQFDQGEEWIFTLLTEDGTVYTPSTGAIIGLKTDGTTILNAGTVNEDGQVVITETEQMTAVPGSNIFEILIDGNTHGTANFVVFVERRPGDIDHPSESDISLFQEAIEAAGNVTQFQADISALQSGLATTNANLTSEANTRASADATLQNNISAEASTRQTQDAVLQAEIDQIIAPSGEAPSAAEVQNARIGVDGTTYDTLGNAIRTQVSDLKNAINDYSKNSIGLPNFLYGVTWKEGYSLDAQGNEAVTTTFHYSSEIAISQGNYYVKVTELHPNVMCRILCYNSSHEFDSSLYGTQIDGVSYIPITVPATGAYIRVSTGKARTIESISIINDTLYNLTKKNSEDIANVSQIGSTKYNLFNSADISNIHLGYYRKYNTGVLTENSAYACIDIECEPNTTYTSRRCDYNTTFYDENMGLIGNVNTSGTNVSFTTPNNAKYMCVNWSQNIAYNVNNMMVVKGNTITNDYIAYGKALVSENFVTDKGRSVSSILDGASTYEVYHVGANREYTSFTACLVALQGNTNDKIIYIDAGTYDIYQEIGGDAFAETVTGTDWRDYSVIVPPNTKIIGLGEVVFNFEIPNTISSNAPNMLSPINVKWSVHVENITINGTNCRYAIHDDGSSDQTCNYSKHVYKNVKLNKLGAGYSQAFGAGIGEGSTFLFEDCVFKSWQIGMSFHNYSNSNEGGIITANNCVFIGSETLYGARLSSLSGKTEDVRVKATFANCRFSPKFMLSPESGTTGATNPYLVDFIGCGSNLVVDISRYEEMQNNPTIYE